MKKKTCNDCHHYIAANGKKMVKLCDRHLAQRLARTKPKWHPTKNPISRMLRF